MGRGRGESEGARRGEASTAPRIEQAREEACMETEAEVEQAILRDWDEEGMAGS